jgi:hypothetical protein
MAGFLSENRPIRTLREILNRLRETYCGNIGYEVRWQCCVSLCCCHFMALQQLLVYYLLLVRSSIGYVRRTAATSGYAVRCGCCALWLALHGNQLYMYTLSKDCYVVQQHWI